MMNKIEVWAVFQEISKQRLLVGIYSSFSNAQDVVEYIVYKEEEQYYKRLDGFSWIGATRKIDIESKLVDENPAIR